MNKMPLFRRRWYYFTLLFKAPKNPNLHRVSTREYTNRLGENRIANIKAGEDAIPTDAELIGILHHGRMTEIQWEKEI